MNIWNRIAAHKVSIVSAMNEKKSYLQNMWSDYNLLL